MTLSTNRRSSNADEPRRETPRPMHISLRAGERLFLNGAVLKVDRKVTLELLNDATFLLENHVLQLEDTKTPIRQLYFVVQAMLMDPQNAPASRALFEAMAVDVSAIFRSPTLRGGIQEALRQVGAERPFHTLKTLRGLFAEEAALLGGAPECELPVPAKSAKSAKRVVATSEAQTPSIEDAASAASEQRRAIAVTSRLQ